jgi:hypothetical protein
MQNLEYMMNNLAKELIDDVNEKFGTNFNINGRNFSDLGDVVEFIRRKSIENPELFVDDYNYDRIKFTVIPKGSLFYIRQTVQTFNNNSYDPVWLDYTGTMNNIPFSFLKYTNDVYTQEYLDNVKERFGEYLMEFRTVENLIIINFPSYVTSYVEGWIRHTCVSSMSATCVDGYTMDLLRFNPNAVFNKLPSLVGFRELCVLNAANIQLERIIDTNNTSSPISTSLAIDESLSPTIIRKSSSAFSRR